eukprot:358735-Chlamydomonas_euryale.AAC.5
MGFSCFFHACDESCTAVLSCDGSSLTSANVPLAWLSAACMLSLGHARLILHLMGRGQGAQLRSAAAL